MVLISACVISKSGKGLLVMSGFYRGLIIASKVNVLLLALVCRVFVSDMSRARLEGLLDAFPKLIGNDKDSGVISNLYIVYTKCRFFIIGSSQITLTLPILIMYYFKISKTILFISFYSKPRWRTSRRGVVSLLVSSAEFNTVAVQMRNNVPAGAQLQVHPNLDKKDWQQSALLKLKSAGKPFPVSNDVGVLKWKMICSDEEQLPIAC
uniref:Coatomer subunit delta n=1 Tax=Heterorhabditis bacteriophora TaxID=37862 RepID=A0A1I7X2N1_HETBA